MYPTEALAYTVLLHCLPLQENMLFYQGAKSADGESLEFSTHVSEVLLEKDHYKTLYNKVTVHANIFCSF